MGHANNFSEEINRSQTQTKIECGIKKSTERRVVLLVAVFAVQIVLLKFTINPEGAAPLNLPAQKFELLVYFGLGFVLLALKDFPPLCQKLIQAAQTHHWRRAILPQLGSYLLIIYSASKIYAGSYQFLASSTAKSNGWWFIPLIVGICLTSVFSFLMVGPKNYWVHFIKKERYALMLAPIFPLCRLLVFFFALKLEDLLGAPTIKIVSFLLRPFYQGIQIDMPHKMLSTSNFAVIVDGMCAGYEGIGMIALFITWYLSTYRKELRFPTALLLFPAGAAMIWLSNCLRIALLVAVGSSVSSDIALNGYHTNAGWICFVAVSLGIIALARSSVLQTESATKFHFVVDKNTALAIPFLIMLAATLLSSAASSEFPWLYPVRAIATGAAILLLWRHFEFTALFPRLFPIFAGMSVFLLWLAFVPPSAEMDRTFSESLLSAPKLLVASWVTVRFFSAILIVPIAEEMAFRGYIPTLFGNEKNIERNAGQLEWLPFIISSALFGALHTAWIAGTIAGVIYYLVRLRTQRLWDAVVAHITTNLLLSCYVLATGHWSYW